MPPKSNEELKKFQDEIEEIVLKRKVSYMDAILLFCEENDFEIERIPRILSNNLKSRIQIEAEDLSLLKIKENRLPI